MHRTLDRAKLSTALARAALEDIQVRRAGAANAAALQTRSQQIQAAIPPRFAATYCSQCGCNLGPGNSGVSSCADHAPAADIARIHYSGLAREAVLLQALIQACAEIESSARDSYQMPGMSQALFEDHWRFNEPKRWATWQRLKTVAGLPLTEG